jgi:hypothetical protein
MKWIIDAHDERQHFDFSGYFEDVTSMSLQSLNVLCQSPEDNICCIDNIGYKT